MEAWTKEKSDMVKRANELHFSKSMQLIPRALIAEKKLIRLREEMIRKDNTIHTGFLYDKQQALMSSDLYKCFYNMPKPVIHHIHLTASCPIDFLVEKLLYYDFVYFNEREQMFKVSKNGCDKQGYVNVNTLR